MSKSAKLLKFDTVLMKQAGVSADLFLKHGELANKQVMPCLPQRHLARIYPRLTGLLTIRRRLRDTPPCPDHLPQIINSLKQSVLRVLMLGKQLVYIRPRGTQSFLKSRVLNLQSLFSRSACIDGIFERPYTVKATCPTSNTRAWRLNLGAGKLVQNGTSRPSSSLLQDFPNGSGLPLDQPKLNYFADSVSKGVTSARLGRGWSGIRCAHSNSMVANVTIPFYIHSKNRCGRLIAVKQNRLSPSKTPRLVGSGCLCTKHKKNVEHAITSQNGAQATRLIAPTKRSYSNADGANSQLSRNQNRVRCGRPIHQLFTLHYPFLHLTPYFERYFAVAVYELSTILARFIYIARGAHKKQGQKSMNGCGYMSDVGRVKTLKERFTLPEHLTSKHAHKNNGAMTPQG